MKMTVSTVKFKDAMAKALKITGIKTIESLQNVKISTKDRFCHLYASNIEQYIEVKIPAISSENADILLSDTKTLIKAMKFCTDNVTRLDYEDGIITLTCGGKKANQKTLNADGFPEFPVVSSSLHNEFQYNKSKLKERFDAVKYAVSNTASNPAYTGIYFNGNDMVAIDGFRIALNKDKNLYINQSFVVPVNAIKYANDILEDNITVATDDKHIVLKDENTTLICRLINGKHMNYNNIFQEKGDTKINIDTKEFINGLKYLKTFHIAKEKSAVSWYGDKLGIQNSSGYYESQISANESLDIEIGFNAEYMLDALSQFKKEVDVYIKNDISPMILSSENDECNFAVVLPLKLVKKLFQAA